jgi:hypothetical protein
MYFKTHLHECGKGFILSIQSKWKPSHERAREFLSDFVTSPMRSEMSGPEIKIFALAISFFTIGSILMKILHGVKLNLYLLNNESLVEDQSVIPLTADIKKRSLWRILTRKNWREDLEITLMDYNAQAFVYQIHYHIWKGFYLQLKNAPPGTARLSGISMNLEVPYYLKSGAMLELGERKFSVLVTAASLEKVVAQS